MPHSPAHEEVLQAALRICAERGDWVFTPLEIVRALPHLPASTVRTHVTSRCCVNAPKNHADKLDYFRRLSHGRYEIVPALRRRHVRPRPSIARETGPVRDTIHAVISRSGHAYVVECMEVAVVTQGHTIDEALSNLREAVNLHLEDEDPITLGLAARPRLSVTFETALTV
jgi:predicted RNase H-like HicB family nuclease